MDGQQNILVPACLVLKPSSACGGSGIVYVQNFKDAIREIDREAKLAMQQEGLVENLELEGRGLPRWVLQEHIESRLICDGRKFHVRAYAVYNGDTIMVLTGRYEIRVAHDPYDTLPGPNMRNRSAHMTNGAGGTKTKRCMFCEIPELAEYRNSLDFFLKRLFGAESLGGIIYNRIHASSCATKDQTVYAHWQCVPWTSCWINMVVGGYSK